MEIYMPDKIICNKCNVENQSDALFCFNCGNKLEKIENTSQENRTLFCFNCGNKIDDVNFCPFCGADIKNRSSNNNKSEKVQSAKHPFYGKDFTNQKIAANLYKDTNNSLGGHIFFYDTYFNFKSHAINFGKADLNINYTDIVKVEFHNFIANLVSTGLNITIKSGETYTFVVWHRQDIKNFLDYKKG